MCLCWHTCMFASTTHGQNKIKHSACNYKCNFHSHVLFCLSCHFRNTCRWDPQIYFFHWAQNCLNWPSENSLLFFSCHKCNLIMTPICSHQVLSISVSTTLSQLTWLRARCQNMVYTARTRPPLRQH